MIPPFQGSKIRHLTLFGLILAGLIAAIACAGPSLEGSGETPEATITPAVTATSSTEAVSEILELAIGPARKECYGPFRRMCLVVDGQFFYDEIDGFSHEPGYEYRLRAERYDAFPGQPEPPQDAVRYGYRLIEEISKSRIAGEVIEALIAPIRVTCPRSGELCLLVNGAPQWGA